MKIQTKIMILLGTMFVAFIGIFIGFEVLNIRQKTLFLNSQRRNLETLIDQILSTKREKYEHFVRDYTAWDDMVNFCKTPQKKFALENIDVTLAPYKLNFIFVFNKQQDLIYEVCDSHAINRLALLKKVNFDTLFLRQEISHFFVKYNSVLIEFWGATVLSSTSYVERYTAANGYFLIGKIWNQTYIKEHSTATGFQIYISQITDIVAAESCIIVKRNFLNFVHQPIETLIFTKPDLTEIESQNLQRISIYIGILAIITGLSFLWMIRKWIAIPLKLISISLQKQDNQSLNRLEKRNDEFGNIAVLIETFFKQQKELVELNSTKDRFFSIIAHDLKSPFNSILGLTDMLKTELKDFDVETVEEYINFIHDAAKRTYKLLENLLDWANMQRGKMPFQTEKINLQEIFNNEIFSLQQIAKMKEIEISCVKSYGEIMVLADKNMLKSILRNLMTNAIKFTRKTGKILLSAELIENFVEISVSDNGVGISAENAEKLFRIDKHLSTQGTNNETGTGLGLILCKEFVEKHGGKIWVESKEGQGTTFKFTLPVS